MDPCPRAAGSIRMWVDGLFRQDPSKRWMVGIPVSGREVARSLETARVLRCSIAVPGFLQRWTCTRILPRVCAPAWQGCQLAIRFDASAPQAAEPIDLSIHSAGLAGAGDRK